MLAVTCLGLDERLHKRLDGRLQLERAPAADVRSGGGGGGGCVGGA